jgi:hypothetical protein
VLARHTGVCRLREGSPPAHDIIEALGTQDTVAVIVYHGDMPEINGLGAVHQ